MKKVSQSKHTLHELKIEVYTFNEHWRWRIKTADGQIIGASSETYSSKAECYTDLNNLSCAMVEFLKTFPN